MGGQTSNTNQSGSGIIRYSGDPWRDEAVKAAARDRGRSQAMADLILGGGNYGAARGFGTKASNPTGKTPSSGTPPPPYGGTPYPGSVANSGESRAVVLGTSPGKTGAGGGPGQGPLDDNSPIQKTFGERLGLRLGPNEQDDERSRPYNYMT